MNYSRVKVCLPGPLRRPLNTGLALSLLLGHRSLCPLYKLSLPRLPAQGPLRPLPCYLSDIPFLLLCPSTRTCLNFSVFILVKLCLPTTVRISCMYTATVGIMSFTPQCIIPQPTSLCGLCLGMRFLSNTNVIRMQHLWKQRNYPVTNLGL